MCIICLSVRLFLSLSVTLFCLSVKLVYYISLFVFYINLLVYYISLFVCPLDGRTAWLYEFDNLFVSLSKSPSVYPYVSLSTYLNVCLST